MLTAFVNSKVGAPASRLPVDLDAILRGTSRSIYRTLQVAPRAVRRQLMLGYLFCRAADTIADTSALPPERRIGALELYRAQFHAAGPLAEDLREIAALAEGFCGRPGGCTPDEGALLRRLESCFDIYRELPESDRLLLGRLLSTLTQGMEMDLRTFPPEEEAAGGRLAALGTDADLDRYCYHVAGCVGEFWTDLQAAHLPALAALDPARMRDLGKRFGKGLQLTNVLRDIPGDLRIGRCYLPVERLEAAGISPGDLRRSVDGEGAPEGRRELARRLNPVLQDLLDLAMGHYRAGWEYTLSIPRRVPRMRLACAWPLCIGLATLKLLRGGAADILAGRRLKIPRPRVYRLMFSSAARVFSNGALAHLQQHLESAAART